MLLSFLHSPSTLGDRANYNRTEGTRPDYSAGNKQDHYSHHNQERSGTERGERQYSNRGERNGEHPNQPAKTAWKPRIESTGDPVRDRENQQKEHDQGKKDDKEKDNAWSQRSGDGWTTSSKSALASGRDDAAGSSPPGNGWGAKTSSWQRKVTGAERGSSEIPPAAGPQTPVFHSGVAKKKVPAVVGQADKVDVWSRGRAFVPEPTATAPKSD